MPEELDVFNIRFPVREPYSFLDRENLQQLSDRLPDVLWNLYEEEGLLSFMDGLLFFENPLKLTNIAKAWNLDADSSIFMRSAFGDFWFWDGSGVNVMHVNTGVSNTVSSSVDDFLNYSFSQQYIQNTLFGKLLPKARQRLGVITPSECYAFINDITKDGKQTVNNLRREDMELHLRLLASTR